MPLPADVALRVLDTTLSALPRARAAMQPRALAQWLRRRYALVLGFVFFGRQDSCVALATRDHGIDEQFIWLRLTEKMKRGFAFRRVVRLPLHASAVQGHASALPSLARLGLAYREARAALLGGEAKPEWVFQLPGEPRPTTRHMSAWVETTLSEEGVVAPPGFIYLGHSLRSGGSSAAEAIGVSRYLGNWLGGCVDFVLCPALPPS